MLDQCSSIVIVYSCFSIFSKGKEPKKRNGWFLFPWVPFRDIFECGYFCKSFGRCMSLFMESLGQRRRVKARPVKCWRKTHPFTSYFSYFSYFFKTLQGYRFEWFWLMVTKAFACFLMLYLDFVSILSGLLSSLVGVVSRWSWRR